MGLTSAFMVSIALTFAISVSTQAAGNEEDIIVGKEVRIVEDISKLDFDVFTRDTNHSWIIGETKTYSEASSENYEGTLTIKTELQNSSKRKSWEYTFLQGMGDTYHGSRYPYILGYKGPLESDSTVISCLNPDKVGIDQFYPIYAVPLDWVSFAAPAAKFYQANNGYLIPVAHRRSSLPTPQKTLALEKELTDSNPFIQDAAFHELAKQKTTELQQLLSDPNPFLGIAAFRLLAENGQLDAATLTKELSAQQGIEQAVMTYLALRNARSGHQQQELRAAVAEFISQAKTAEQLRGIALGLLTAGSVSGQQDLLKAVDVKQAVLNSQTPADDYVSRILQIAGIRPTPDPQPIASPAAP